jgi:hypothetical protein
MGQALEMIEPKLWTPLPNCNIAQLSGLQPAQAHNNGCGKCQGHLGLKEEGGGGGEGCGRKTEGEKTKRTPYRCTMKGTERNDTRDGWMDDGGGKRRRCMHEEGCEAKWAAEKNSVRT